MSEVIVICPPPAVVEVQAVGARGPVGPQGDPGITVSATPPPDPSLNELWFDIS